VGSTRSGPRAASCTPRPTGSRAPILRATQPTAVRPPPWRDVRILRAFLQVAFLAAIVAAAWYLYGNLTSNLRRQGITTGFDYLDQPAGFAIQYSPFRPSQTVREAIYVGIRNTAAIAAAGIALTTVLGVIVGVARLSTNWLVRKAAAVYVETLRNLPPLLVILFMNFAIVLELPQIQEARDVLGHLVVSNRQLAVTSFVAGDGIVTFALLVAVALAAAGAVARWRSRRSDATGERHHRVLWGGTVFLAIAVPAYLLLDGPVALSRPAVEGRAVEGGIAMGAPFAAVLVALVLYTASHVAEIVRGSIQAVPKGQTEAASAVGLSDLQRLRFVVLPQAFRIAIPPMINQYLNLTKNTSLGIAIGFTEITALTFIIIGNGNPAPQSILLLMAIYLFFSLVISALSNLVNRRLQLVER
jgi:general L-amino acid transport system permease protein